MHPIKLTILIWMIAFSATAQIEPNSPYLLKQTGPSTPWPNSTSPQVYINGSTPVLVGSLSTGLVPGSVTLGSVRGLFVYKNIVFLKACDAAVTLCNLNALDASNKTSIKLLSSYTNAHANVEGMSYSGKYIVSSQNNGFNRVDVSNPSLLTPTGYGGLCNANGCASYIQGRYVFSASFNSISSTEVLPTSPLVNIPLYGFLGLSGTSCSGTVQCLDIYIQGNYAYIVNITGGLFVVNISNPATMTLAGSSSTGLSAARSIFVQGEYAYIADSTNGLIIYSVKNPTAPTKISTTTTGLAAPTSVYIADRYAYVADNTNGLIVFDISNPASPRKIFSTTTGLSSAQRVFVRGRYAYVADNTNGLVIFDIGGQYDEFLSSGELDVGSLEFIDATAVSASFFGGAGIGGNSNITGDLEIGINTMFSSTLIPTVSSCGTSAFIDNGSVDTNGRITVGSASPTSCTLSFAKSYASVPYCVASGSNTTYPVGITSASTTNVVFNFNASFTGNIYYRCIQ